MFGVKRTTRRCRPRAWLADLLDRTFVWWNIGAERDPRRRLDLLANGAECPTAFRRSAFTWRPSMLGRRSRQPHRGPGRSNGSISPNCFQSL